MTINSAPNSLVIISDLEFGGAQRQAVELCNQMCSRRFQMNICSLSEYTPLASSLREREERFFVVPRKKRFDWTVVPRLVKLIKRINAQVVHCYLFDAEIAGRLAGKIAGIPVIASERNTNYSIKKLDFRAFKMTNWARKLTIANSSAGADFNSRTFGLPRETYRVVHNGVDTTRFYPRPGNAVRHELGIPLEERVVGMFGSFKAQKNHSLMLRAARQTLMHFPKTRFLFVGDELHKGGSGSIEFKSSIERLVDELKLRTFCVFAGNRSDVERYYNACDLTALPSLFEGTPNVALESMACGVPVIASDVSDNAYVIPHNRAGLIFPSGDESALARNICRLLSDDAMRQRLGQSARDWVLTEFTGRRLADKTADVYEEVLRHSGKHN
ncbi:MAG: glycosyltransferase [Verrucomicrobiales bacterium]